MTQDLMKLVDGYAESRHVNGAPVYNIVANESREAVVAALEELTKESKQHLSNLLARIHRDGGHYEAEHGTQKAVQDADLLVATLHADLFTLTKDAERDVLEQAAKRCEAKEINGNFRYDTRHECAVAIREMIGEI